MDVKLVILISLLLATIIVIPICLGIILGNPLLFAAGFFLFGLIIIIGMISSG